MEFFFGSKKMNPFRSLHKFSRLFFGSKCFPSEYFGRNTFHGHSTLRFSHNLVNKNNDKHHDAIYDINHDANDDANFFDVVIVGSGMIGASLACGLTNRRLTRGLKIALVDAKGFQFKTDKSGTVLKSQKGSSGQMEASEFSPESQNDDVSYVPDPRTVALSPSSVDFLDEIGVWRNVDKNLLGTFNKMQVWNSSGSGFVRYDAKEINENVLGYVIENKNLMLAIQKELQNSENLEMIFPALVNDVHWPRSKTKPFFENKKNNSLNSNLNLNLNLNENFENKHAAVHDKEVDKDVDKVVDKVVDKEEDVKNETDEFDSDFLKVFLSNNRVLKSRLIVGADGKNSKIRALAKIRTLGYSYDQSALIANVKVNESQSTAWQIFLPNGPLALLPLHDNFCNVVYSTTEKEATFLKSMPEKKFVETINRLLRSRQISSSSSPSSTSPFPSSFSFLHPPQPLSHFLSSLKSFGAERMKQYASLFPKETDKFANPPDVVSASGARLSFPLGLSVASRFVVPRGVLVGDSAHSVHPLAGQGANLGLSDARNLVRTISRAVELGEDIGNESLLSGYEKERMAMNYGMVLVLDGLHKIFKPQTGVMSWGRNVGLHAFNAVHACKKAAMSVAMGKSKSFFDTV